ncbi:MAG TPA: YdeI/OmpD-associated family protein [Burkholderiaceae bacterium]
MAKTPRPSDDELLHFDDAAAWELWLKKGHAESDGAWLRIAKPGAERASVRHADALEVALCYGWIDAAKRNDGPHHWLQRFTPRSARSIWSKVNRAKALALVEAGRMQPAGQREIARAQADGRWDAAYDSGRTSTVPPDLRAAFDANPKAAAFFATLDSSNRYSVLFRLQTAKRAETRERRLSQFVEMLARGEKLHP